MVYNLVNKIIIYEFMDLRIRKKGSGGRGGEGGRKVFFYSRLLISKERMMELGMGRGNYYFVIL